MSRVIYHTELQGVSAIYETTDNKVVGYKYSEDADSNTPPKWLRYSNKEMWLIGKGGYTDLTAKPSTAKEAGM